MRRFFSFVLCFIASASPCLAQQQKLDPEGKGPYKLRVVLHVAHHRILTSEFQDRLKRELHDNLQAALGDLACVEVVQDHPLLNDVLQGELDRVPDSWKFLDDVKLHFVFVNFTEGNYEITARQYDGSTGLASPLVQRRRTEDRELVAREAALLVSHDFGMVGTLTSYDAKSQEATLAIKAGALGTPLDPWIEKDDVFAVVEVFNQGGTGRRSYAFDGVYLQVLKPPQNGLCVCRLFNAYGAWPPPGQPTGHLGIRCIKLKTTEAKLRLRVVATDKQQTPQAGRQVWVSPRGFGAKADREEPVAEQDGITPLTQRAYKNLAFVEIPVGQNSTFKIPVAILGDRIVICKIPTNEGTKVLGELATRLERLKRQIDDARLSTDRLFRDLTPELQRSQEKALKVAKDGRESLRTELLNLGTERQAIQKELEKLANGQKLDFGNTDELLKGLSAGREQLDDWITRVDKMVKEANDPATIKARKMVIDAESLEQEADFAGALALYEQAFSETIDKPNENLRKRIEDLKKSWALHNEAHRLARSVIYDDWPQCATAREMNEMLPKVADAFKTCQKEHDLLTPCKLVKVYYDHVSKLNKESAVLKIGSEDDIATGKVIDSVLTKLEALHKAVTEYLPKPKKATNP